MKTVEQNNVWTLALTRHHDLINRHWNVFYQSYRQGFAQLQLNPFVFPTIEMLNDRLASSGWTVVAVDGYVDPSKFFALLSKQHFPVTMNLRKIVDLDHAPAPDFIHDVFGHLPLLFDEKITQIALALGECARSLSASGSDQVFSYMQRLNRLYTWTLEFGVLAGGSVLGAGIISSYRETHRFINDECDLWDLSSAVLSLDIDFSGLQNQFFILKNLDEILFILDALLSETTSCSYCEGEK